VDRPYCDCQDLAGRSSQSVGRGDRTFAVRSGQGAPSPGRGGRTSMLIEMSIKGLMVDPITNMPIVILKDKLGERVLSIWVGIFEANAIALQIENVSTPRPMTHDLLRNIITDLEGSVDRVVVSDLKDNTFFAVIHLTVRGERVAIDARPSDAIALALRTRSPILVEEAVIDNAKTVDFASEPADNARLQKWLESLDPEELGKYKM
jgi:bifunctional DNase/RNase